MSASSNICKQPVVAIVGHIDHGKTTLLDYIRKSAVAAKETGGITQKIGAYEVEHQGAEGTRAITFIDTPGHEAFQKMRRRGAKAADIAILVIAADDGVKPQTIEAYRAITDAKIPYIVAFTKIDKDSANLERAKESVMREGIYLEGLGGEVPFVGVSGKSGVGVPELLDLIILAADLNNVACDASKELEAIVIESARDSKAGIGATVIVKSGTLSTGGFVVAGGAFAPLRIVEDYTGAKAKEISCGKPARIIGWSIEPPVGSIVSAVKSKKEAEERAEAQTAKPSQKATGAAEGEGVRTFIRLVVKADTAGSLEAVEHELTKINEEGVELRIIASGVGPVTESDVKPLIGFSPAVIIGFNVKAEATAKDLAERQNIVIETRAIIYELGDWLSEEVKKWKPASAADAVTGSAEILRHFSTSGAKHVVGGRVNSGTLSLKDQVTIVRRGIEVGEGKITNLQMQKADVSSVPEGMEFGAQIESKADIVQGDTVTASKKSR